MTERINRRERRDHKESRVWNTIGLGALGRQRQKPRHPLPRPDSGFPFFEFFAFFVVQSQGAGWKVQSGLAFFTGPGYDSDVMAPAVKATLPQPGLQRRWTALDGEDVSDGGEPCTGYGCPLPLVDDLRGGFAKLSADAPWQCPRSQTRDDQRRGFAWNKPLIAAKLSVAIADHNGTIVERYTYSAFGMPSILTPPSSPVQAIIRTSAGTCCFMRSSPTTLQGG